MIKKTTKKVVKIINEEAPVEEKCVKCKIDNLSISFGNEDMNKVVEKINELINKTNDSI